MRCPICDWKMKRHKGDGIREWQCSKGNCGFMATASFMDNLTPEMIEKMKDSEAHSRNFRIEMDAKREADKIAQKEENLRLRKEALEGVGKIIRKEKKVKSLGEFNK
jgi:hypothetical protein